ncbi:MAG: cell wall-active antibiotics response protein [candidate division Zixibacteria bacterium]|nr:cell wall-active antibiotics response protein [candidate division Zixibacteria bacterium]MBU1471682.1 cell wall-active antibiotics response protein [candidate division Zixibacteria bacterium]MBU2625422.1 cell wall-active antibiotics response protein [candidate division Zixibacteria bacterium]
MNRKWTLLGGAALIVVGMLLVLDNLYVIRFDFWDTIGRFWSVALIAVGIWLIYRQAGCKVGDATPSEAGRITRVVGQIRTKPDSIHDRGLDVQLGAGSIEIDLTETNLREGENSVAASVGLGEVVVKLPAEIACNVSGSCGIGDVHVFSDSSDGFSPRVNQTDPDYDSAPKKIKVTAKSGLGDVKISRR